MMSVSGVAFFISMHFLSKNFCNLYFQRLGGLSFGGERLITLIGIFNSDAGNLTRAHIFYRARIMTHLARAVPFVY